MCEVCDSYWLAHVEDEDFSSVSDGSCFEYESAGFRYEHEVAYDVGVCDGDGSSLLYLFAEEWYDGSVGSEYVAESCGDELCGACDGVLLDGFVEALYVDFAEPFGASHDVGGVDGFVGGYHDELADVVFDGEVCDDACSEEVVDDGL